MIHKKIKARRKARKSANKWVLGEKLTKAGRKRASARKNVKKINKRVIKLAKKGKVKKAMATVKTPSAASLKAGLKMHGKIKKGWKSVTPTAGGAYPTYGKKTRSAKSFKKTFAAARKGGKKTFSWQGRKYTTKLKK